MKVKKLIAELKKMPQNLSVAYAHGDNYEHEIAGDVLYLMLFEKKDFDENDIDSKNDKERFRDMPERCVIIRG